MAARGPARRRRAQARARARTHGLCVAALLREALRGQACELWISGRELEGPGFWSAIPGLAVHHGTPSLDEIDAVVLPAWVEHQPRVLLQALARGVPVIASRACGLAALDGVLELATGDATQLRERIEQLVSGPGLRAQNTI